MGTTPGSPSCVIAAGKGLFTWTSVVGDVDAELFRTAAAGFTSALSTFKLFLFV